MSDTGDNQFAADPEQLKQFSGAMEQLSNLVAKLRSDLQGAYQVPVDGSSVGKVLTKVYTPVAQQSLDALGDLSQLLSGHGDVVADVSKIFGDMDASATSIAASSDVSGIKAH